MAHARDPESGISRLIEFVTDSAEDKYRLRIVAQEECAVKQQNRCTHPYL